VHGVYFGEVAAQRSPAAHHDPANLLHVLRPLRQRGIVDGIALLLEKNGVFSWVIFFPFAHLDSELHIMA